MAPFCLLVFFIGSDRAFNFPEDLAGHFADRSSQHIGGSLRIKIKDVQKILVFKIVICIAHRPGKDGICDADSGSSLKGSSDVEFIISFQIGICNDVTNLPAFFLPVIPCKAFCRFHDMILQRPGTGRNIKRCIQCPNDRLLMLRIHFPELYRAGILPFSGICHIKYIPQFRLLTAHILKLLPLGYKLLRQGVDDLRVLNHLIQNGIVHIHSMLADGRENFIKHPVFKSFCRWQFTVNDQPVNIAFRDKGDFNDLLSSIPILVHLLNDPLAFR